MSSVPLQSPLTSEGFSIPRGLKSEKARRDPSLTQGRGSFKHAKIGIDHPRSCHRHCDRHGFGLLASTEWISFRVTSKRIINTLTVNTANGVQETRMS